MAGKKGMKHYELETKLQAVQLFYEQGHSRWQIAQELDLPREGLVEQWVCRFRREGVKGF